MNNENNTTFLEVLPIPENSKAVRIHKNVSGTPTKFTKWLHCNNCGRKRDMRIATTVLDAFGKLTPMYFNVKKLKKAIAQGNRKLPEKFLAICGICFEVTPYKIANERLVAEHSSLLDPLMMQVFNERVDTSVLDKAEEESQVVSNIEVLNDERTNPTN